jgi:transcriptional regulator
MTEFLEGEQSEYTLEENNPRMEKYLDYIQMFEITISNWEGKFKLSQDKKPSDREAAKKEMSRANSLDITNFLNQVSE